MFWFLPLHVGAAGASLKSITVQPAYEPGLSLELVFRVRVSESVVVMDSPWFDHGMSFKYTLSDVILDLVLTVFFTRFLARFIAHPNPNRFQTSFSVVSE